jgi:tetratricopeptide (TPR) repeat protein
MTVDDLQWVDPASAGLIAYLVRRIDRCRAMVVLGSRTLDRLPGSLDELAVTEATRIHLEPLVAEELTEHATVDLARILKATGGVPLLVKEAIDTGITPASPSVLRYMESRRNRLSDLSRQVMATASVLDGMCDAALLRDTSGRTDEEIVDAVEELISAGLLREEGDGTLVFSLDVLGTSTYDSTSLIRRRLLHKRAAEALAVRPRARLDARLATAIAAHFRAAGNDEAAEWYRLAGDLARDVFANDEAVVSYETAIALEHGDKASLRLVLGELAMARGDYPTANRELLAAAAQSVGSQLSLVEHRIGDLHRILGRFDLAEQSFATSEGEHPEPAELYADWALLRHRIGDADGAVDLAGRAVALAEGGGRVEVLARVMNILGVVTSVPSEAMAHIDRALDLVGADVPARMAALNSKAHLLAQLGDVSAAKELVDEAIEIARRSGYRHHQAALLNHLADLRHADGDSGGAEAALTEAVTIFADIVADDWEPEVWLLREW